MYLTFWSSGMHSIQFTVLHFFSQWYGLCKKSWHHAFFYSRPWPAAPPCFLMSQCSHPLWGGCPVASSLLMGYLWALCSGEFQCCLPLCFWSLCSLYSLNKLSRCFDSCSFLDGSYQIWSKRLACEITNLGWVEWETPAQRTLLMLLILINY